jgi:hypothetical protein
VLCASFAPALMDAVETPFFSQLARIRERIFFQVLACGHTWRASKLSRARSKNPSQHLHSNIQEVSSAIEVRLDLVLVIPLVLLSRYRFGFTSDRVERSNSFPLVKGSLSPLLLKMALSSGELWAFTTSASSSPYPAYLQSSAYHERSINNSLFI